MAVMKLTSVLLLVGILSSAGVAQTAGQPPAPTQQPTAPSAGQPAGNGDNQDLPSAGKIVARTNEVGVIFTVTDKHGKFIKDLKQNEFKILDDNKPPREITNFEAETNLPLRVGLLIDASTSIRERFLFEQEAATRFLQQVIRPQTDQAFVLAFDEVPEVTQDFTNDLDKLTRGIKAIRPGGGTALWDAIYYACRDKLGKLQEQKPVRKVIVLVSDGDDNQSRVLRQEAIDMAERVGAIIYCISTNFSNIKDYSDKNLKMMAEATGGQAFFPFHMSDLETNFNDIQGELRSQYSVSYKPEDFSPNGKYRAIDIAVADNKKLRVRARKGYFATSQ